MKKFITTTEINELFGTNIVCKRITDQYNQVTEHPEPYF